MPLFTGRARSVTTEGLPATPVKQEPPPHQEEATGGLKVEVEARDSASATPEQFGRRPRAATGYDRWRDMARDGEGPSFTQARDQLHGSSSSFTGATRFNADGTVSPESQSQSFKSTASADAARLYGGNGGRLEPRVDYHSFAKRTTTQKQSRDFALSIIFAVCFVDGMSQALTYPVMPFFVEELGGDSRTLGLMFGTRAIPLSLPPLSLAPNPSLHTLTTGTFATFATIASAVSGILSDKIGHRPVLFLQRLTHHHHPV